MRVPLTKEHIDAAIAALIPSQGNVCECCPVWQALLPIIGHPNFRVGFNNVNSSDVDCTLLGKVDDAGAKITWTSSLDWRSLKPTSFEYTPVETA